MGLVSSLLFGIKMLSLSYSGANWLDFRLVLSTERAVQHAEPLRLPCVRRLLVGLLSRHEPLVGQYGLLRLPVGLIFRSIIL